MARLLVFADDATGALEAGALLADAGVSATVSLDWKCRGTTDSEAAVVLLPTRHLEPAAACELTAAGLAAQGAKEAAGIYWKTDSTLRGPIGACCQALLDALPGHLLVYVPAYPEVGRTARRGVLYVHGVPVAETEFGRDALNPVGRSSIVETVADGCRHPIRLAAGVSELKAVLDSGEGGVVICDAESAEDVAALFEACRRSGRRMVAAGPAGGIRHWAGARNQAGAGQSILPAVESWLIVCGSRHPVSRAQAEAAREAGFEVISTAMGDSKDEGDEAGRLARLAVASGSRAMMIFGGDTALAVWQALGIESLVPVGELLPGVAVSCAGGRVFVTKAGGFGERDLVEQAMERWRK